MSTDTTSGSSEAPNQDASVTPDTSSSSEEASPDQEAQPYEPNYKYKAYDRDGEIEEWARQYIKDKETEDKFRQLYSKSTGFDHLKDKYKSKLDEASDYKGKFTTAEKAQKESDEAWSELRHYRDNDLGKFFETCKISDEKLVEYLERRMEYLGMPENKRAELDRLNAEAHRARQLERQVQQFESEKQTQTYEQHHQQFEQYLGHPEVGDFASRYDDRVGEEGAFKKAVIEHGNAHFHTTGEVLGPLDAIRAVYRRYKPFVNQGLDAERQGAAQDRQVTESSPQHKRPATIPNITGSASVSPSKKVFQSLDDLKKHVKSLQRD